MFKSLRSEFILFFKKYIFIQWRFARCKLAIVKIYKKNIQWRKQASIYFIFISIGSNYFCRKQLPQTI